MISRLRFFNSALVVLSLMVLLPAAAQGQAWVLLDTWGSPGSYGAGGFTTTMSVAADRFGYTYAADENSILKLIGVTYLVTRWNPHGATSSSSNIESVAVDPAGNVYIAEHNTGTIQKFSSNGIFLTQWSVPGSGAAQNDWMTGLAVDASGTVYLADENRRRVMRFASDGTSLADLPGVFLGPTGVAVDDVGNIYVADYSRIMKFSSAGTFVTQWGSSGNRSGQFGWARGVAVDANSGFVYVTDFTYPRVQQFTTDGVFVSEWGEPGSGAGALSCPTALAVDVGGYVYVADGCNFELMKFGWGSIPVAVAKRSWGELKSRYR